MMRGTDRPKVDLSTPYFTTKWKIDRQKEAEDLRNEYFQSATRLVRRIGQLHVSVYAAHTSFFLVLSLFPSLVLLLSLLRYTGLDVSWLTDLLEGVIPNALLPAAKS